MLLHILLSFLLSTHDLTPPGRQEINFTDSLTVHVFLLDECVISLYYTPLLSEYYHQFKDKKVGFIGHFPNPSTSADEIKAFAQTYKIAFPLVEDYDKSATKRFGVKVTPEVAVWDHKTQSLIYRGRIDDSYVRVGKRKYHPQHPDLKNTIEDWLNGKSQSKTVETQAIGCLINFGNS